jgi:hypothetical protein
VAFAFETSPAGDFVDDAATLLNAVVETTVAALLVLERHRYIERRPA